MIGIVDHYGAVHGVPKYTDSQSALLIHEDVFTVAEKRWRYRVSSHEFLTLPDRAGDERYQFDAEQTDHAREFLRRRGWL